MAAFKCCMMLFVSMIKDSMPDRARTSFIFALQ
jgi:hypothetical protein